MFGCLFNKLEESLGGFGRLGLPDFISEGDFQVRKEEFSSKVFC